ncbi:hypothetical protein C2W62_00120 [Candidatus Entotheonella serta]|nr:hypothetical protein C2W62_00120 [Candidatus Entotheonella serta]
MYLPLAISDLVDVIQTDQPHTNQMLIIQNLLRDILLYSLFGDEELIDAIQRYLEVNQPILLQIWSDHQDTPWELVRRHVQLIL